MDVCLRCVPWEGLVQSPIKIILNVITDLKLENKSSEESNCALACSMDGWRRQSCNCNAKIKRILAEFYCFVIWIIDNEQLFKQSSPSRSVMSNMILSGLCKWEFTDIYLHVFCKSSFKIFNNIKLLSGLRIPWLSHFYSNIIPEILAYP